MKTKENFPRILDAGEPLTNQHGRKFGYTEKDFLEAYFGKDNSRNARIEIDEEASVFGFNDSYKKKYPINKYQKLPKIEAERRFIEESSDLYSTMATDSKDPRFVEFLDNFDMTRLGEGLKDTPHPTEKGRSYLKDTQNRIDRYMQAKERKTGVKGIYNTGELAGATQPIEDEYFPKPKEVVTETDPEDAKQDEKFEPFYEGEGKEAAHSDESTTTE